MACEGRRHDVWGLCEPLKGNLGIGGDLEVDELNGKQLMFIAEYVKSSNATEAAIKAGYSKKTAYSQGQRLLKNAEIQRKIESGRLDIKAMIAEEVVHSLRTVITLRDHAENETVRLKAAQDLLDRAGFKPTDKKEISGPNGGMLPMINLSVLSDEELTQLEQLVGKTASGDTRTN